jgi:1-deoxy-D-xylulose-5-phosphate synthase
MTSILDSINTPRDIKSFSSEQLDALVIELRRRIIETVSRNGGHLSSPLGVVELTVALHYVYDIPEDKLIWDVGHQCYAHKLLTGRAARFDMLRKCNGISGYPKISESIYDCFGTGHSSTSISAALGMAIARNQLGLEHHVVSLIGDGAMTGGMAFEALNHAGHLGLNMLVILNDNEMSISRNVGALARYFNRLITATPYKRAKQDVGSYVKSLIGDRMTRTIQDIEKSVKGFITKGGLFQDFGFNYIGPVDGHDLPMLIEVLRRLKQMEGPVFLHCTTEKGKGLKAAEEDPLAYHGVKPFVIKDAGEGDAVPAKVEATPPSKTITFTDAFAKALLALGENDPCVVAITAAMPTGTGLSLFEKAFPERFFDVGICEQHAVTLAAGLATEGIRPVLAIYSTFLQRGYDQVIHDVCLQKLPVIFAIDRAGMVGEDSPTQNGAFDLSFLRSVPNLIVLVPRDDVDTALMLEWAATQKQPVALRYARDIAPTIGIADGREITHAETLREGNDLVFLTVGPCAATALEAAERLAGEGHSIAVVDARSVKPLDTAMLDAIRDKPIVTVEENALAGGFGSAVLEYYEQSGQLQGLTLLRMGFDDIFYEQASRKEQLALCNLTVDGLCQCANQMLAATQNAFVK